MTTRHQRAMALRMPIMVSGKARFEDKRRDLRRKRATATTLAEYVALSDERGPGRIGGCTGSTPERKAALWDRLIAACDGIERIPGLHPIGGEK